MYTCFAQILFYLVILSCFYAFCSVDSRRQRFMLSDSPSVPYQWILYIGITLREFFEIWLYWLHWLDFKFKFILTQWNMFCFVSKTQIFKWIWQSFHRLKNFTPGTLLMQPPRALCLLLECVNTPLSDWLKWWQTLYRRTPTETILVLNLWENFATAEMEMKELLRGTGSSTNFFFFFFFIGFWHIWLKILYFLFFNVPWQQKVPEGVWKLQLDVEIWFCPVFGDDILYLRDQRSRLVRPGLEVQGDWLAAAYD